MAVKVVTDGLTYAKAGVDIPLAERVLEERIKPACLRTQDPEVLKSGIGPFAAAIMVGPLLERLSVRKIWDTRDLVLMLATDGPGTIPLLARVAKKAGHAQAFRTLGYNVAAHLFADLACGGGYPVAVLDSIGSTDIDPDIYGGIVEGMADACMEFSEVLGDFKPMIVGGETAQLPGLIKKGETNFEGFAMAVVHRDEMIKPEVSLKPKNFVVGIPVDFQMLNGVSLLRKILAKVGKKVTDYMPGTNYTFAEMMIQRQPNFAMMVHAIRKEGMGIWGASHITGGGLPGNLKRILPPNRDIVLEQERWEVPEMFRWFIEAGDVPLDDAYKTWNMGIGYVLVIPSYRSARKAVALIREEYGLKARIIGRVTEGSGEVIIK